jgi:hypothetical protein
VNQQKFEQSRRDRESGIVRRGRKEEAGCVRAQGLTVKTEREEIRNKNRGDKITD